MKELLLEVDEKKYKFLLELLKNFDFVQVKKNSGKKELLLQISKGMQEAQLASRNKIKSRPIKELLDEL